MTKDIHNDVSKSGYQLTESKLDEKRIKNRNIYKFDWKCVFFYRPFSERRHNGPEAEQRFRNTNRKAPGSKLKSKHFVTLECIDPHLPNTCV